jgi:hypothetical protein
MYVEELSNSKPPKREVNTDSGPERWIWKITPRSSFQIDNPHIIGNISYQMGNDKGQVDFNPERLELRERYVPGLITIAFKWLKDNATIILGIVASLLTLVTTIVTVKKLKVDTKNSELQLKLSGLQLKIKALEASPSDLSKPDPAIEENLAETKAGVITSSDTESSVTPTIDTDRVMNSNNNREQ